MNSLTLIQNQIQIWQLNLQSINEDHNYKTKLERLLSQAELERANSFSSGDRIAQFTATRAVLRILLAKYSSIAPQQVEIKLGTNGKPFSPNCGYFNLSHSRDLALFAFSKNSEIGIDIEYLTARNFARLIKKLLNSPEQEAFLKLTSAQQLNIFYQYWTKKEAQIKLNGGGIFRPNLESSNVFNFVPHNDYMAAIAYNQSISSFEYRIFEREIDY